MAAAGVVGLALGVDVIHRRRELGGLPALREALGDHAQQLARGLAVQRRDEHRVVAALDEARAFPRRQEVGLVEDVDARDPVERQIREQRLGRARVLVARGVRRVEHVEEQIGAPGLLERRAKRREQVLG